MKTERRHELETNTLAHQLKVWGEKLEPYSPLLLGGVAALLALYVIMSIWNSYGAARDRAAWDEYQMAVITGNNDMRELQTAAAREEHTGALTMQDWAYVGWADRQLLLAANEYFVDKTGVEKRLSGISAIYEQLADSAVDPEVRNRARLGLARVNELQSRPDEAVKQYKLVKGALGAVAAARAKDLESPQVRADEQWLATAKAPAPRMPSGAGTPGARPNFGAAAPSTDGPPAGFDASSSLEDILGGLNAIKPSTGPARYDAQPAEGTTDADADAEGATDAAGPAKDDAADASNDDAAAPAADEAAAPAADDASAPPEESPPAQQ